MLRYNLRNIWYRAGKGARETLAGIYVSCKSLPPAALNVQGLQTSSAHSPGVYYPIRPDTRSPSLLFAWMHELVVHPV